LKLELDMKVDFVIHAASQASPKYYFLDPIGTINANTVGTSNLLDFALSNDVESFLYFSSAEIYGETPHIPTAENNYGYLDPLNVRSCYAESKRIGENMCVSWHHQNDVPAKIVRPFHTYGPYMKLNDGRVYADLVSDALTKDTIVLKSDGVAMRSFCYLADATAGFWIVLLNGTNAQAYNIGNPDGLISIRDLADLIASLSPAKKLNVIAESRKDGDPYMISNINVSQPDISKAMKLGWRPYTSLAEGFRKTIESYKL
jgi:nucleoside-diphosphate-sugar epimerase